MKIDKIESVIVTSLNDTDFKNYARIIGTAEGSTDKKVVYIDFGEFQKYCVCHTVSADPSEESHETFDNDMTEEDIPVASPKSSLEHPLPFTVMAASNSVKTVSAFGVKRQAVERTLLIDIPELDYWYPDIADDFITFLETAPNCRDLEGVNITINGTVDQTRAIGKGLIKETITGTIISASIVDNAGIVLNPDKALVLTLDGFKQIIKDKFGTRQKYEALLESFKVQEICREADKEYHDSLAGKIRNFLGS